MRDTADALNVGNDDGCAMKKKAFQLVKTIEFEIESEKEKIRGRLELFQDLERSDNFKLLSSEANQFRMQPTFPQDVDGLLTDSFDELIWSEKTFPGMSLLNREFRAPSLDDAVKEMLADLEGFENHLVI
ncbi:MAG: hypothetical protein ACT4O9_11655 [Blastocatellia bacterium]